MPVPEVRQYLTQTNRGASDSISEDEQFQVAKWLSGTRPSVGYTDDKGVWIESQHLEALYTTYSGADIVAEIVLPHERLILGELQTLSYSIHRENTPVRILGHVNPVGFVKGPRTIAGSLIFTVFNYYAFYRVKQFGVSIAQGLYPVADMLPPFDIVVTFANENGSMSKLKIYGVTMIQEGQTMSVDDLIVEQTYQYMARGIQPMTAFAFTDPPKATESKYATTAMGFNH